MKTRIYNFMQYVFDEMPYYKVFVLFTVLLQLISIPLIMFLFEVGIIKGLISSNLLSMLVSSYVLSIIYGLRKHRIFCNAVDDFQCDLMDVKTKQDVLSLFSKYNQLRKLSSGDEVHRSKLNELQAVIMVKFELLPDSDTICVTNQ